ncbi:MAG TPA: hypothetical protein VFS42_12490, partial [Burkholderiaceae bacterium]|nr:hypothetical protein [Burkholderiaceae bacterium]
ERMRQIAAESELMRRGVHAQAEAASAPAVAAPAAPDASALGARRLPAAETETRPTPRGEAPEADLPAARRAAAPGEEEAAPGRPRPSDIEELTGRPRAAEAEAQRAQQLAVEGAAARIAGSEMQLAPQRVIVDEPAAINRALGQVTGEGGPLKGRVISDEPHPDGGRRLVLERADGERVSVRVVVGETEGNNVANFARGAAGDDWVVTLSPRARESTHARALAHELEELRFHGLPADRVGAGDVLQARVGANPDAPLSAHDRGRLAEMQVLGEALRAAHAQGDVAQVARLQRDMDSLAGHLGLLHADAADPRMARVREAIPEGHPARGELDDARTRARTPGADDALHPARPITDDTHLSPGDRRRLAEFDETAHRLADAHARGDAQEIFRLTRELADRASRLGLLDTDAATDRRAALARSQFEDDSVAARALDRMRAQFTRPGDNDALRPGLVPEPGTVLSPRDRQRMADLDTAVARLAAAEAAGADAPTLARLRHDAESQAAALGLVHGRAADARSQLASTGLSAESVARLDAIRALARDNPLLRPRTGTLEDIPLLARQIRRAQEMGDTRLAAELTEIAGMRLHEAGLTGGADATARAQARAELARIIGNDPVARTLADDAMQRQFARQRAGLLRDEASNVRAEISQAQERLQAAASTRKEVGPGVLKRTPEEVQVRREIAALERRAAALDNAASRAERIAFRAPGATVEAALAARADDPMFAIAPRLRSDPDYPGNPTQVRLITQMYGDSPQFQSWHAFKQAYYDLNPSTARGAIGHNPEHVEGVVFAAWRAGGFVSESTGRVQSLRDLERVPIAPGVDVAPAPGATRRLPDTLDINVRVRDANGQLVEQPLPVPAAEARRRQLIDDRQDARRRMDTAKTEAQRTAAKAEVNELTARINDVSEALGVAAGRQFASERFGSTGTLTEGRGAGVPDLIHEAPNNGRITVIECKGGTSELGERRATREGRAVMAEQGSPEYLRSLALDMQESGNAEMRRLGDRIIEALDRSPPNIDYVVVRQPFDDTGGRGPFTVSQHPIERSGK